jgi:hypothetical protein
MYGESVRIDPSRLARTLAASDVFNPQDMQPRWLPVASRARSGRASGSGADGNVTATLGRLYLDQGHLDEAERIFRRVLEGAPGNSKASRGLAAVKVARLAAEYSEPDSSRRPVARSRATRRRIKRLERFLQQVSRPLPGSASP